VVAVTLEIAQESSPYSFNWSDVDYQLLSKLANSSDVASLIISRLMIGDLYGCIGLFVTEHLATYNRLHQPAARHELERDLSKAIRALNITALKSATIALHIIKDVNKTQREIAIQSSTGQAVHIGVPSRRIVIGVFIKNSHLSMTEMRRDYLRDWGVPSLVLDKLRTVLDDSQVTEVALYGETDDISN